MIRALPFLVLAGCGGVQPVCQESPLGGTCTHIEGTWLLESGERATRCGAQLFDRVLITGNSGGILEGSVSGKRLSGRLYPMGVFELFGTGQTLWIQGQHQVTPGQPDELRGGVTFSDPAKTGCETHWQFIAKRE